MTLHPLEQLAKDFATEAHGSIDHRRKYDLTPYIGHPASVAEIVRTVPGHTPEMLAAAWLHDTVEDVPSVTLRQIREVFGDQVAVLVESLTDVSRPSQGNRKLRETPALWPGLRGSSKIVCFRGGLPP